MSDYALSEDEFYRELVNRFFHQNSYFYHCLGTELEALLAEAKSTGKQEYLLLGHLMDQLVSSSTSATELEDLGNIRGFAEFRDKLRQGVRYLYETELDSERMKVEIESLAHSILNSALLALQDEQSVGMLRLFLGFEQEPHLKADANPDKPNVSEIKELPSLETLSSETEPTSVFTDEPPHLEKEERNLPSKLDSDTDVATNPDDGSELIEEGSSLTSEIAPSLDSATEAVQAEAGQISEQIPPEQPISEDITEHQTDTESISLPPDCDEIQVAAGIGDETTEVKMEVSFTSDLDHANELPSAEHGIQGQISQLDEICRSINAKALPPETLQTAEKILGSITLSAMIRGSEALEQVGGKSRRAIAHLRAAGEIDDKQAKLLLKGALAMLKALPADNSEHIEPGCIKEFTAWVRNPEGEFIVPAAHTTTPDAEPEESNQRLPIDASEPEAHEENVDYSLEEACRPEQSADLHKVSKALVPSDFKLPGEDDLEIVELIREINRENETVLTVRSEEEPESDETWGFEEASAPEVASGGELTPSTGQAPSAHSEHHADDAFFEEDPQATDEPSADSEDNIEAETEISGPDSFPKAFAAEVHDGGQEVIKVDDSPFGVYKKQAELYFSVIDEALEVLQHTRQNHTALEDLELASNALYGLTLKLNLDIIGAFPDLILALIKNTIATNYRLSDVEHELLAHSFSFFKSLGTLEEYQSERFQAVLQSIRNLSERVKNLAQQQSEMKIETGQIGKS